MVRRGAKRKPPNAGSRSEETRLRLLAAALEIFGRSGYEAATTRQIAAAAGVNLQAIPYHFGGKEGLYLAVADYLAGQIRARIGPQLEGIRERLAAGPVRREEARQLLTELLVALARVLVGDESEPWARFIVREQMEPTQAFERLWASIGTGAGLVRSLVATLLDEDPRSERVALRTLALLGQVVSLRAMRATALRLLGRRRFDLAATEAAIADSVALLGKD